MKPFEETEGRSSCKLGHACKGCLASSIDNDVEDKGEECTHEGGNEHMMSGTNSEWARKTSRRESQISLHAREWVNQIALLGDRRWCSK